MAEAGQRLPVHGEILVPLTQLAIIRGLSQHNKLLFVHSKFKSNTQIFGSDRSSRNAIARLSVHVAQVCQEHRTLEFKVPSPASLIKPHFTICTTT